jgi:hypothetical protein
MDVLQERHCDALPPYFDIFNIFEYLFETDPNCNRVIGALLALLIAGSM